MIFSILGTDHYRVAEKLKEMKDGFIAKRDKSGLNVVNIDGEHLGFDHFKSEVMATPFLGDKKMVVVKNFSRIAANKKIHKEIANFFKKQKEIDNVVGFVDMLNPEKYNYKKPIPAGPLFKFLSSQKYFWTFNQMNNRELGAWLKKYFADHKVSIEQKAIDGLIIRVGNDLNQMSTEIKKLTAYKYGEAITIENVENLVKAKFDENIFDLVDALGNQNKKVSLKLISDQLACGTHELMILKMIQRQFKIMLQVKSGATARSAGLHPFVYQKANGQAKNFDLEKLKSIFSSLVDIESQLKTGTQNPELVLNLFVAKNC